MDHRMAEATLEALPPACTQALDAHVRQLDGEALDDAAAAALREHREGCAVCRELIGAVEFSDRTLRGASAQPRPGFVALTMAALPAQRVQPATRTRWGVRRWLGVAALLALVVGFGALIFSTFARPALGADDSKRRALVDDRGNALNSIPLNTSVTAKDHTLLRGRHREMVNVRRGAHFKLAPNPNRPNHDPQLQLASGDLYGVRAVRRRSAHLRLPAFRSGAPFRRLLHRSRSIGNSAERHDRLRRQRARSRRRFRCIGIRQRGDAIAFRPDLLLRRQRR